MYIDRVGVLLSMRPSAAQYLIEQKWPSIECIQWGPDEFRISIHERFIFILFLIHGLMCFSPLDGPPKCKKRAGHCDSRNRVSELTFPQSATPTLNFNFFFFQHFDFGVWCCFYSVRLVKTKSINCIDFEQIDENCSIFRKVKVFFSSFR